MQHFSLRLWYIANVIVVGCVFGACRQVGDAKKSEAGMPAGVVAPQRVGEAKAEAAVSTRFDVDERSGRPKSNLVLRLDYFPETTPGSTSLPACYQPFPADFDLGVAVCETNAELRLPVLAKNVDQDCYTDTTDARIAAASPLLLPGCKRGAIFVHSFEPRLRVDAEIKEVN